MTKGITALTIAGSDSGGGAGVQADLKTFAAHGVFGLSAITAVTAQNSLGVLAVHAVPASIVAQQIEAVATDFGVGAAKTGMLFDRETIESVAGCLETLQIPHLVVDPVMVATSGDRLLADEAIGTLKTTLLPRAAVVTPNHREAERLTGGVIRSPSDAKAAARSIHEMGAAAVIVTGGDAAGAKAIDVLYDGSDYLVLEAPRIDVNAGHGTGCTFSAAVTAQLACGRPLAAAARAAKSYVERCLRHALDVGRGPGPLDHFCRE